MHNLYKRPQNTHKMLLPVYTIQYINGYFLVSSISLRVCWVSINVNRWLLRNCQSVVIVRQWEEVNQLFWGGGSLALDQLIGSGPGRGLLSPISQRLTVYVILLVTPGTRNGVLRRVACAFVSRLWLICGEGMVVIVEKELGVLGGKPPRSPRYCSHIVTHSWHVHPLYCIRRGPLSRVANIVTFIRWFKTGV